MSSASRLRIETALSAIVEDEVEPTLCAACARLVGLSGAAIVVMRAGAHRALLCSSGPTAAALEDLQNTLGEGPGVDAYRRSVPVVDADLAASDRSQWLAFAKPALDAGAAAVFAFPLRVGAVRLGTLTFHHDRPGQLSDDQSAEARCVAEVVTDFVLARQAQAPPGMLAQALSTASDAAAEVHQ
ncbi:MAG: GAF domain-containing protein, partial [Acidimicrobiales bacterium]